MKIKWLSTWKHLEQHWLRRSAEYVIVAILTTVPARDHLPSPSAYSSQIAQHSHWLSAQSEPRAAKWASWEPLPPSPHVRSFLGAQCSPPPHALQPKSVLGTEQWQSGQSSWLCPSWGYKRKNVPANMAPLLNISEKRGEMKNSNVNFPTLHTHTFFSPGTSIAGDARGLIKWELGRWDFWFTVAWYLVRLFTKASHFFKILFFQKINKKFSLYQ